MKQVVTLEQVGALVRKKLEAMKKGLEAMEGKHLRVGIDANAKTRSGTKVADYAEFIEYGNRNTAPRPFMRNTIENHRKQWAKRFRQIAGRAVRGESSNVKGELMELGNTIRGDFKKSLMDLELDKHGTISKNIKVEVK